MATITVSPALPLQTRNWSDTTTWNGGVLPAVGDDIVANATSGDLYVNATNRTCLTINFTNFTNTFRIENGITLTVTGSAITLGSGMTFTSGTTGILATSAQAAITIIFAGITIPNLSIGKSTGGGSHAVTISGTTPIINRLVTFGAVPITLTGPALTITNSIVINTTISSGSVMSFLGTVTMSGAGILGTGFTVPALSTLIIGSNVNAGGNITFASGSFLTPGAFTFGLSGGFTLDSVAVTWGNFTLNGNGVFTTLITDLNISGNLYIAIFGFSLGFSSATTKTINVQGSFTGPAYYSRAITFSNIITNLIGTGTFAVPTLHAGVGTITTVNINTANPTGYVIGSATFTGANGMQFNGSTLNLIGTSVASAYPTTPINMQGATFNTNRSSVGGSNPIYSSIYIYGSATFTTDTTCTGNLALDSSNSGCSINGGKVSFGGNLSITATNAIGTSTLEFIGSNAATWTGAAGGTYQIDIIVNKSSGAVVTAAAGNITWGGANKTLTLNTTVNFTTNSNTFILTSAPVTINNSSASQFFNMTVPNGVTLNINNNTTPILGTLSLLGSATFAGTHGWTCGTLTCSASNSIIILQASVTYTTTTSVIMLGTNAQRITIRSNAPTVTYAIWTLQNPATQSMVYVNAQGINSNAGMTIYSFQGVVLTSLPALNWFSGASQGTKAFTFVS
jgi:hypothetical protein